MSFRSSPARVVSWILRAILVTTTAAAAAATPTSTRVPVLVELFTSQSCSSCPPAEALTQQLYRQQPIDGVEILVLAEHVDYWNHLSWRDPYSSAERTERQRRYARQLGNGGRVYTPQAVVDGRFDVIGSQRDDLIAAIQQAARVAHVPLRFDVQPSGHRRWQIRVTPLPPAAGAIDYAVALVQDGVLTSIPRGENAGARLVEDSVVLQWIEADERGLADLQLPALPDAGGWRVIVFAQRRDTGAVIGSAQQRLSTSR